MRTNSRRASLHSNGRSWSIQNDNTLGVEVELSPNQASRASVLSERPDPPGRSHLLRGSAERPGLLKSYCEKVFDTRSALDS